MIPKMCKQCRYLARSSDGVDTTRVCLKGCSIDAVMYGMNCGQYKERDDNDV